MASDQRCGVDRGCNVRPVPRPAVRMSGESVHEGPMFKYQRGQSGSVGPSVSDRPRPTVSHPHRA